MLVQIRKKVPIGEDSKLVFRGGSAPVYNALT